MRPEPAAALGTELVRELQWVPPHPLAWTQVGGRALFAMLYRDARGLNVAQQIDRALSGAGRG